MLSPLFVGRDVTAQMRHLLGLCLFLSVMWLLWSGHYTPLLLSFGAASVLLVLWLSRRMDVIDAEGHPLQLGFSALRYWLWLSWQILLANMQVIKVILRPATASPAMRRLPAVLRSDMSKVIYANSITLTPGTVTVNLENDDLLVHALQESGLDDLVDGDMARQVAKMDTETAA